MQTSGMRGSAGTVSSCLARDIRELCSGGRILTHVYERQHAKPWEFW